MFSFFKVTARVRELEEKVDSLKRDHATLELEWINFYDKAKRMMGRIAKRAEAVDAVDSKADRQPNGETLMPVPNSTHGGRLLTPHQLEIQQSILKRRAGG